MPHRELRQKAVPYTEEQLAADNAFLAEYIELCRKHGRILRAVENCSLLVNTVDPKTIETMYKDWTSQTIYVKDRWEA